MEVGPITPAQAAEKALAAWTAAIEAIDANASATDALPASPVALAVQTPGHEPVHAEASVPVSEPTLPGCDSDQGHESATLQSMWRPTISHSETPRTHDVVHPDVPSAQGDFATPDALLVQATLTGLRTEPSMAWSLPTPSTPWQPPPVPTERPHQPREPYEQRRPPAREQRTEVPAEALPPLDDATEAPQVVIDADDDGDWLEALARGLQAQLTQLIVPPALLAAREQWLRGRCVVLACPQRPDPAGAAWAHVLWPHPEMRTTDKVALRGLRVEARLQWLVLPPTLLWAHARLIREHHPRHGRQMVVADAGSASGAAVLPCEVQLGPVLERVPRRCEVRVHVSAAQRLWAALGRQWSVHLVVCARPLLAAPPRVTERKPC